MTRGGSAEGTDQQGDLSLLQIDVKGNLSGKVTLVEKLGTETVVELITENGTPFRYAAAETPNITTGDKLKFKFESDKAHLF